MHDEEITLNRKYLGALAVAAIVIIGTGVLARASLRAPAATQAAPPSEASALQRFSQENQLRGISGFVGERVAAVAPHVVRVPEHEASGIRWGGGDTIVTTRADRPAVAIVSAIPLEPRSPLSLDSDSVRRDWVIVVARDQVERVVSWSGMSGGRSSAACGPRVVEKYVLGFPPGRDFAGGGVFDLAGRLRGMVIHCGDALVAVPASEVMRLMADTLAIVPDSAGGAQ